MPSSTLPTARYRPCRSGPRPTRPLRRRPSPKRTTAAPRFRPAAWSRRPPNGEDWGVPFVGHWYAIFGLVFYAIVIVLAVWLVLWGIRITSQAIPPANTA